MQKINKGSSPVGKTGKEFHGVAEGVGKTSDLIGEIWAASLEQPQGIEQVSQVLSEVDKVIQQNAAGAEEPDPGLAEIHIQAGEVKGIAKYLWSMMNGLSSPGTEKTIRQLKDWGQSLKKEMCVPRPGSGLMPLT